MKSAFAANSIRSRYKKRLISAAKSVNVPSHLAERDGRVHPAAVPRVLRKRLHQLTHPPRAKQRRLSRSKRFQVFFHVCEWHWRVNSIRVPLLSWYKHHKVHQPKHVASTTSAATIALVALVLLPLTTEWRLRSIVARGRLWLTVVERFRLAVPCGWWGGWRETLQLREHRT